MANRLSPPFSKKLSPEQTQRLLSSLLPSISGSRLSPEERAALEQTQENSREKEVQHLNTFNSERLTRIQPDPAMLHGFEPRADVGSYSSDPAIQSLASSPKGSQSQPDDGLILSDHDDQPSVRFASLKKSSDKSSEIPPHVKKAIARKEVNKN